MKKRVKGLYPDAFCSSCMSGNGKFIIWFAPGGSAQTEKDAWKSSWDTIQESMIAKLEGVNMNIGDFVFHRAMPEIIGRIANIGESLYFICWGIEYNTAHPKENILPAKMTDVEKMLWILENE